MSWAQLRNWAPWRNAPARSAPSSTALKRFAPSIRAQDRFVSQHFAPPQIGAALFAAYGAGYAIGGYILACAIITIGATAMMTDYTGKDIEGEYE